MRFQEAYLKVSHVEAQGDTSTILRLMLDMMVAITTLCFLVYAILVNLIGGTIVHTETEEPTSITAARLLKNIMKVELV